MRPHSSLRLTVIRRRRHQQFFLLFALLLGFGGVLIKALGTASAIVPQGERHTRKVSVIVEPGDSVWKIAKRFSDESINMVKFQHRIARENHLEDENCLTVGQRLIVPVP